MFKVLGVDLDHTDCECCGKTNLKLTVVLGRLDADKNVMEIVRFGRDCAARATRIRSTGAGMESLARQAEEDRKRAELAKIHEVGEVRSVRPWKIESVGCNGGSLTVLGFANGLLSAVTPWAKSRWPNHTLEIQLAR